MNLTFNKWYIFLCVKDICDVAIACDDGKLTGAHTIILVFGNNTSVINVIKLCHTCPTIYSLTKK